MPGNVVANRFTDTTSEKEGKSYMRERKKDRKRGQKMSLDICDRKKKMQKKRCGSCNENIVANDLESPHLL